MRKFIEFAMSGLLVVALTFFALPYIDDEKTVSCSQAPTTEQSSIAIMYEGYVEQWKKDVSYSFDVAEKEVYGTDPVPVPVGPDPDPAKCICKGTGVIKQGDGHVTPCPYHGKQFVNPLLLEK